MSLSIQQTGNSLNRTIKNLNILVQAAPSVVRDAIEATVLDVQGDAAKNAPYKSGTLRRSIDHRVESSGGKVTGYVGTNVEYAAIHEFGGRAGRNKSLRIKKKGYFKRAIAANKGKLEPRIAKLKMINRA